MIPRYTTSEMGKLWGELRKKQGWHDIEVAVLKARESLGEIPSGIAAKAAAVAITPEILARADEIEAETDHDLVAFIYAVAEHLTDETTPYYHQGLTSFDVEDTALALLMVEGLEHIVTELDFLCFRLREMAIQYRRTLCVERSHGQHAKPITFGLKMLNWFDDFDWHRKQLAGARRVVGLGKVSGAVGAFTHDTKIEAATCANLGLRPARISTQVISRRVHLHFAAELIKLGNTLDHYATEIRILSQTGIGEVSEYKSPKARGSSAMPGKRRLPNPIKTENVCGLAKLVRGYIIPALECQNLWGARTLDNSSAERIYIPDLTILVHFMVRRFREVLEKLVVYPDQMERNLNLTKGIIYAEEVLNALTAKGMPRKQAHDLLDGLACQTEPNVFTDRCGRAFMDLVWQSPEVNALLTSSEIEQAFDPWHALRHIDQIYARFGIGSEQEVTASS